MHIQQIGADVVRAVEGRGFAFVPRALVSQPKAFGVVSGLLEPAHDVDETDERYRAAMVQHVMTATARGELLKMAGLTPARYVARFTERGLGADRVRRIFRGETMAQLADVMFWVGQFPAVGAAIAGYTSDWFTTSLRAELEEVHEEKFVPEAHKPEPTAPARRTPQNPYASSSRRIR